MLFSIAMPILNLCNCFPKVLKHHASFVNVLSIPSFLCAILSYDYKMNRNGDMTCRIASKVVEHVHLSPQYCLRGRERWADYLKNDDEAENINIQPM